MVIGVVVPMMPSVCSAERGVDIPAVVDISAVADVSSTLPRNSSVGTCL